MPRNTRKSAATPTAPADLLDMEQAIAALATTRPTFYRWLRAGTVKGVKLGRQWRFRREDIDRFLRGEGPRVDLPDGLKPLIQDLRKRLGERAGEATGDLIALAAQLMLQLAPHMKATDLHLRSCAGGGVLQFRIDGSLTDIACFDARFVPPLVEWLKRAAGLDPANTRQTQDGRIRIQHDGQTLELRVTTVPTTYGECLVARLLEPSSALMPFARLDFGVRECAMVEQALRAIGGLLIFAGATGSGKTTAMYSCAQRASGPATRLVSVERFASYSMAEAVRMRVDEGQGMSYPAILRSVMRIDADIIALDDLRDRETMEAAIECAITGHRVLGCLHAADAIAALRRVADLCSEHATGLEEVRVIVAQRLVRRLCPACAVAIKPAGPLLRRSELVTGAGGLAWSSLKPMWKHASGCEACRDTGFNGRMMVSEVLEVTPELRAALRRNASDAELRSIAIGQGFASMAADGVRKAAAGMTSLEELQRSLPELAGD